MTSEQLCDNTFEAIYAAQIARGEIEAAYNTLGDLMRFGMIDKNDDRLTAAYFKSTFKPAGLDAKHHFQKDLRYGDAFILDWAGINLPQTSVNVQIDIPEHPGKRVENGYEGDVTVPGRVIPVVIRPVVWKSSALRYMGDIRAIYAKWLKVKSEELSNESMLDGTRQLFTIEVAAGHNIPVGMLGFIMIKRAQTVIENVDTTVLSCRIIMEPSVLEKNNMVALAAYKEVSKAIKGKLLGLNKGQACEVKTFTFVQLKK